VAVAAGVVAFVPGGGATPTSRVVQPRLVAFASADVGFLLTWDRRELATRNGGRTWRLRARVGLVAADFVSAERGFGLTERGMLLATSDGGRRWRRMRRFPLTPTAFAGPPEPVVDFVDGRHGWVAAGSALIFRTVDGGRRWTRLRFGCPNGTYLGGLAFADLRHGFAACGEQPATGRQYRTYYLTGDGGTTWRRGRRHVDEGYVATLAYPAAGAAYVYADRYGVSRRDGPKLLLTDDTDSVVSMSWPTPSRGYVVLARAGLRRTDDGGRHWRRP
jgi:photosystem II stability/assembly factor-like uncharacterized protein